MKIDMRLCVAMLLGMYIGYAAKDIIDQIFYGTIIDKFSVLYTKSLDCCQAENLSKLLIRYGHVKLSEKRNDMPPQT